MLPRPLLLFLCFSLAWTFACAYPHARAYEESPDNSFHPRLADESERAQWRRQIVRRQLSNQSPAAITIVKHNGQETEVIPAPASTTTRRASRTTAAVETTSTRASAVAQNPKAVESETSSSETTTTRSVRPSTTTRTLATSPPAAATTTASSTTSLRPVISTSSSSSATRLSSPSLMSSLSSSISSSSTAISSATSSSPSASASIAISQKSNSFVDPSNKYFPLAVIIFIAFGLIGCFLIILLMKRCCHRRRTGEDDGFRHDELFPASSRDNLADGAASTGSASPDSFDEKWMYPSQHDAGMRMHGAPSSSGHDGFADDEDEEPLAYLARRHSGNGSAQNSDRRLPPGAAPPQRSHGHRRTASVVLPPVPAVTHQPRHDDFSSDPLPSSQPSFRATPPSALLVARGAQHAQSPQPVPSAQPLHLPHPPSPMNRPHPPVPAQPQQRSPPAYSLPHQPARPSSLRIAMSVNSPEQPHPPHMMPRATALRRDQLVLDEFGIGAGAVGVVRM